MKLSKSAKVVLKVALFCVIMVVLSLAVPALLSAPDTLMNISAVILTAVSAYFILACLIPSIFKSLKQPNKPEEI